MRRFVIVGLAPGPGGKGKDGPVSGRCGRRLAAMMGLTEKEYLRLWRLNLLRHAGQNKRAAAQRLISRLDGCHILVLGREVARAMGLDQGSAHEHWHLWRFYARRAPDLTREPETDPRRLKKTIVFAAAVVPHPSGRNRWYNETKNMIEASRFLRETGERVQLLFAMQAGVVSMLTRAYSATSSSSASRST